LTALEDAGLMGRAFALAERGLDTVAPNPAVGCVIARDGVIVGEGWHERPGEPHAEDVALAAAGEAAHGATAYVTLEPCAHQGRTGPCADALVDAGIVRAVIAATDPNPQAAGGAAILEAADVEVVRDVAPHRARTLNERFFHIHEVGRPHVTLKVAQTLDGKVAAADGTSRWITGRAARTAGHALRARADVVVVGSGTVLADDPALDVRHVPLGGAPPRPVVLDARGRTPPDARVVGRGALVLCGPTAEPGWRDDLRRAGAEVVELPPGERGGVDLPAALAHLHEDGVQAVLVEGGPTVAAGFLRERLVDRIVAHLAASLLGGDGRGAIGALGVGTVAEVRGWRTERITRRGADLEIRAVPRR
jgi:diaminohydroxyphosphoribosylaminopyrimidine deaminase / 5-amino-6-(5-phosphoribosylamino)uracil reductase